MGQVQVIMPDEMAKKLKMMAVEKGVTRNQLVLDFLTYCLERAERTAYAHRVRVRATAMPR